MSVAITDRPNVSAGVARKLLELAYLPENWDTYGSPAISADAICEALAILGAPTPSCCPEPQITPASGGGVFLLWRRDNRELEITTRGSQSAEFLLAVGDEVEDGTMDANDSGRVRQLLVALTAGSPNPT